jgi:hypothetical protein
MNESLKGISKNIFFWKAGGFSPLLLTSYFLLLTSLPIKIFFLYAVITKITVYKYNSQSGTLYFRSQNVYAGLDIKNAQQ